MLISNIRKWLRPSLLNTSRAHSCDKHKCQADTHWYPLATCVGDHGIHYTVYVNTVYTVYIVHACQSVGVNSYRLLQWDITTTIN